MSVGPVKTVELYGGAFTIDVPERFVDISYYRHIPNHQEVYMDPNNDQSIIMELNSYQEVDNKDAITLHWNDLMKDSESESPEIIKSGEYTKVDLPNLSQYIDYVGYIDGTNKVGKYKEEAINHIHTFIVNMRMKCVTTDLLLIFNLPITISNESTAAAVVTEGGEQGVEEQSKMDDNEKPKQKVLTREESDALIQTVVKSFQIKSMSIFPEMQ